MRRPTQSSQTQEPMELGMETLRRRCQRLKLWQWFGLALVSVPFAGLVLYELLFERTGAWSYWLIALALIGFAISFVAKRKERRAWMEFLSDTAGEDRDSNVRPDNDHD